MKSLEVVFDDFIFSGSSDDLCLDSGYMNGVEMTESQLDWFSERYRDEFGELSGNFGADELVINFTDLTVGGFYASDYPDFSDAHLVSGKIDGREMANQDCVNFGEWFPDVINQIAHERFWDSP